MAMECEAKIKVECLDAIRERLRQLGAEHDGRVFERNWVLDRPDGSLLREGTLLRVRNTGGAGGVVTVKRKCGEGEFKTREEVETRVDSTDTALRQLAMVGFGVTWRYEKYRDTWRWGECAVALDECPEIGCFVEIEGAPEAIRRVAAEMGVDCGGHLGESYLELWREYLRGRGEGDRHMVFAGSQQAFCL